MKRYVRLFGAFFRLSLVGLMEFKANFLIEVGTHLFFQATNLVFFGVLWGQIGGFGGLSPQEMLLFVGTFVASDSVLTVFAFFGITDLPNAIRSGDMDHILAKPVSSQFYATFRAPNAAALIDLCLGLGMVAYAVGSGGLRVAPTAWAGWVALLVAGTAISYSVGVMVMSLAFVFLSVGAVWALYSEVGDIQRYPIGLYSQPWRTVLTVTLPVVLVANVPAHLALGKIGPLEVVWFVVLSMGLVFLSTRVWKWSLRRYQSASS